MSCRLEWLAKILKKWHGLEDWQLMDDSEESLSQHRYLVVEHGRDCSRKWFTTFDSVEEVLIYAVERVHEDEWAFTAAYDLATGEELELKFHAELTVRKPISIEEGVAAVMQSA